MRILGRVRTEKSQKQNSEADMTWNVWVRLCTMMFLQYFIWGAWAPVLSAHIEVIPG
jgi:hypothetical protein